MRFRPSIFVPVALLVLGACGGGSDAATGSSSNPTGPTIPSTPATPVASNQIEVDNDVFSPGNITVPVNTTVHWTWGADARAHNVTFTDGSGSGDLTAGGTFDKNFATAGTFNFHCTIHATMTGSVLVTQ
jgi:plastocyanin